MGRRQFADLGPLKLESGGRLPAVRLAYETWGELNEDGTNAVLVLHALTGDSHVTGEAGDGHPTPGWWSSMVGPGAPIDTDRWFVVAPNVLGGCQGSTGPASPGPDGTPWGSRFPLLTVRDQVAAEIRLSDLLGIDAWALVIGASLGGLRVLEWAASAPRARRGHRRDRHRRADVRRPDRRVPHRSSPPIRADPRYRDGDYYDAADGDGPHVGLGLARQIAHQTYRSAKELDQRFGRIPQGGEQPLEGGAVRGAVVPGPPRRQAGRRFDANTYVVLTRTMITHDLGRDRGGVAAALASVTARALVIAVDSDRLFPPAQSERIAAGIPDALAPHHPLGLRPRRLPHRGGPGGGLRAGVPGAGRAPVAAAARWAPCPPESSPTPAPPCTPSGTACGPGSPTWSTTTSPTTRRCSTAGPSRSSSHTWAARWRRSPCACRCPTGTVPYTLGEYVGHVPRSRRGHRGDHPQAGRGDRARPDRRGRLPRPRGVRRGSTSWVPTTASSRPAAVRCCSAR